MLNGLASKKTRHDAAQRRGGDYSIGLVSRIFGGRQSPLRGAKPEAQVADWEIKYDFGISQSKANCKHDSSAPTAHGVKTETEE